MSSEQQKEANRANAAKSAGPVTLEGKLKSSRNRLRHGMLARTVLLAAESQDRFAALLANLVEILQPQNGIELALIETMAVVRWRSLERMNRDEGRYDRPYGTALDRLLKLREKALFPNEPRKSLIYKDHFRKTLSKRSHNGVFPERRC